MKIRESDNRDRAAIERIQVAAFGPDKGPVIAGLVNGLLADPTADPVLSLVAEADKRLSGHILFTRVRLTRPDSRVSARILAPLAVLPAVQNRGVGQKLIRHGFEVLKASGVDLVFVLGHPGYYPRCGFAPAGEQGFRAPYPIPDKHADAWMVRALNGRAGEACHGTVCCADTLNRPGHWRE